MKKILLPLIAICVFGLMMNAQVAINTSGNAPAASSMLDVSSNNKGMLMPRLSSAQRKAIVNPDKGLLVFDLDQETIYFFNGEKWKPMMTATNSTSPLISREVEGSALYSQFGASADMYDNYAVVGAPNDTAKGVQGGAAYVFVKENNHWKQMAKLSAPSPVQWDKFGNSVSIYGDLLVVGSPERSVGGNAAAGAIYVFKRSNNTWNYVTMLTASIPGAYDKLGYSVSTNGTYIVAGAPFHEHNGINSAGAVYIFGLYGSVWGQKAIVTSTDPTEEAEFGYSVDIWQSSMIVGAPKAYSVINGISISSGAGYIYNNTDANGFTWPFTKKLFTGYGHADMKMGHSVSIDNNRVACGAPSYSGDPQVYHPWYMGAVFQWKFENGSWTTVSGLVQDYGQSHEAGKSVAISNGILITGVPGWHEDNGRVLVGTSPLRSVYDEDPNLKGEFGNTVAIYNGEFLITSPQGYGRVFFGLVEP